MTTLKRSLSDQARRCAVFLVRERRFGFSGDNGWNVSKWSDKDSIMPSDAVVVGNGCLMNVLRE